MSALSGKCLVTARLQAYDDHVLLGRTSECGHIDGLLEGARRGESSVLVLRGDPGIGKTALLCHAEASWDGLPLLTTRGVETEAELAFAALAELLEPVLDRLDRLPAPQIAALESALALRPPVPGDAFAVAAGVRNLIVEAGRTTPILLLVDDAQWLDAGSASALLFALRRLAGRVVALVAVREAEESPFLAAGLPELEVVGLAAPAAAQLLRHATGGPSAAAVTAQLVEATAGNPLALLELPALLDEHQLAGRAPVPEPLPVAPSLRRAFSLKIEAMPEDTKRALVVAAAGAADPMPHIVAGLQRLGIRAEALEPAERAGLVSPAGDRVGWRHPLLRSTAYYGASSFERRAAHDALASVSSGAGRAWHRAAATIGPDDEVAKELEEVATDARLRRGHAAAAVAFEHAAGLSTRPEGAARRLLEAARDCHLSGHVDRARVLLRRALGVASAPTLRADLERQLGIVEMWGGDAAVAHELLLSAAGEIEGEDPARAAAMLVDAALACQMSGDVQRTLEVARRADRLEQASVETRPLLLNTMILAGQARAARGEMLELAKDEGSRDRSTHADPILFAATVGHPLTWLGEHAEARRIFERELRAARASGTFGPMPFLLACLSELEFRVGRWHAAYEKGVEAVRIAEETGQVNVHTFAIAILARIEAATGRESECREHAAEALTLAGQIGAGSIRGYALAALGLLELGAGRTHEALGWLDQLAALTEEQCLGDPGVLEWASDLVEAQIVGGRTEAAHASLVALEAQAERTGNAWAAAAVARARGMLVGDDFEEEFARARRGHVSPFERARTELRLGERLRRERRPSEARTPLRSALGTFESLGASGWAAQARAELAAAGERSKHPKATVRAALGALTEQELRIALLIAEGVTNREAAAALYLSPKTIGYHLGKVYAKLGVRSRTELAHLLTRA